MKDLAAKKSGGTTKTKTSKKSTGTNAKSKTKAKPKNSSASKPKSNSVKAKERARQRAEAEFYLRRNRFFKGLAICGASVILFILFAVRGEKLWYAFHQCYWGLFGVLGFSIPFITAYYGYQLMKEKPTYRFQLKICFFMGTVVMLATAVFAFSSTGRDLVGYIPEVVNCFREGSRYAGAGFIGGVLGILLTKVIGSTGAGILSVILFLLFLAMSLGALLINVIDKIKEPVNERINENKEVRSRIKAQEKEIKDERRKQAKEEYVQKQIEKLNKKKNNPSQEDFRRIDKTPFYEPNSGDAAEEAKKKKPKKDIEKDITEILPKDKEKKPKKKTKPKKPKENLDYINEESPVFAEGLDIDKLVGNNSKPEFIDDEDLIPPVFSQDETTPARRKGVYPIHNDETVSLKKKEPQKKKSSSEKLPNFEVNANGDVVENYYIKPPFTLLEPQPESDEENIALELQNGGRTLVDTLKSFGVQTTITNISRGPSVTRYELQPAAGVKISKITNLSDDIAMNLAATGVRIEAPIPGKSAVGIEVPNKHVSIVKMRNLVESREFQEAKSKLTVALGMDITGKITLADLSRMPHLLIAGSTGSGKSVCINSMLVSLLYKSSPDEVKLMLIDPKVVELGVYNGIPHLLVPVVTDPRKAAGALNWAVNEMLERYKTFAEYNVRDMQSYNRMVDRQNAEVEDTDYDESERSFEEDEMLAQAQSEISDSEKSKEITKLQKMPQIVIVIDELADLMMAAPNEVEESICRLAQMARAAGMHLVIATQRPSVDVITGLIKANVPSRIAFAVKSQIDSRTILDTGGADKLLGRGDMLFSPIGKTKPVRVQGCYVDDVEIENIINFIKRNKMVEYDKNVIDEIEKNAISENNVKGSGDSGGDTDPMMEQAIQCVVEAGQASTSLLQRRLRLGYARAGRLIDEMEQMGIVGPHEGSKPRQVLMSYQQWLERNMTKSDDEFQ